MFVDGRGIGEENFAAKALTVGTWLSSAPLAISLSRRSGLVPGVTSPSLWLKDRARKHGPMRWFRTPSRLHIVGVQAGAGVKKQQEKCGASLGHPLASRPSAHSPD